MSQQPKLIGLEQRREFHCLTQQNMADLIGCTQSQYAKFESGKIRLDVHRAAILADRLGCHVEELL